jgi:hypothetical protein
MVLKNFTIKVVTHCTSQIVKHKYNQRLDDGQSDLLQNVHFKEPWFITLWLNGQMKFQMPYEDTTMWACVPMSNLPSCIMTSILVHQKD